MLNNEGAMFRLTNVFFLDHLKDIPRTESGKDYSMISVRNFDAGFVKKHFHQLHALMYD
jgi:hypothetical protein